MRLGGNGSGARTVFPRAHTTNGLRTVAPASPNGSSPGRVVDEYGYHCRPALVRLLSAIGLDAVYERAHGDTLWLRRNGKLVPILDLVGGYGANLFGHHHPELVAEARASSTPGADQRAGVAAAAGRRLAEELCRRLGDYVVTFTNSGTETIEAAIKHVHLERRARRSGRSRAASTARRSARSSSPGPTGSPTTRWDPRCDSSIPTIRRTRSPPPRRRRRRRVILEPIAGEGGIKPLPAAFAARLRTSAPATTSRSSPTRSRPAWDGPARSSPRKRSGSSPTTSVSRQVARRRAREDRRAAREAPPVRRGVLAPPHVHVRGGRLQLRDRAARRCSCSTATVCMARCAAGGEYLLDALATCGPGIPHVIEDVRGQGMMVGSSCATSRTPIPHPADALAAGASRLHGRCLPAATCTTSGWRRRSRSRSRCGWSRRLRDRGARCSARRRPRGAVPCDPRRATSRT